MLSRIKQRIKEWVYDDSGATAIEYGLLTAFIGLTIIVFLHAFGGDMVNMLNTVNDAMTEFICFQLIIFELYW